MTFSQLASLPLRPLLTRRQIFRTSRQHWSLTDAAAFYAEHAGRPYVDRLIQHAISGPCLALGLIKHDAIAEWREMIGPTHVYKCVEGFELR